MPACPVLSCPSSPLCLSGPLLSLAVLLSLLSCPLPLAAKNKVGWNGKGGGRELWGAPDQEDTAFLVQISALVLPPGGLG